MIYRIRYDLTQLHFTSADNCARGVKRLLELLKCSSVSSDNGDCQTGVGRRYAKIAVKWWQC